MNAPDLPPLSRGNAKAEHSRFVQRVRRRYADMLDRLPAGVPDFAVISALVAALESEGMPVMRALRVARQLVLERLAVLDIEQDADQAQVTAAMTHLAEATLERAHAQALADVDPRWGVPRNAAGDTVEFWIIGMGKLGARELNVSSDIDLIYVYEEDALTDGERPVSAQEYFGQVARRMYALIGDVTDDGFVFRVDLALRPNGNSGPPVVSLAMLEEYFLVQGREWERFAWLKSRVVAPRAAVTSGRALALRSLVTPFVYRRYLDYGVFEGLRTLHHKIREEAQRRAAGRPERANDVKLSRGGIREIEFIVQLLLVVRGGQFPEIRTRSTLKALDKLVAAGLMKPETGARLNEAYVLLRRIEHRIQFLDDQQTHLLPTNDDDLRWIAASLGLSCGKNACELLDRLGETREFVSTEFDTLLHDGRAPPPRNGGCRNGTCNAPKAQLESETWLDRLPPELGARVRKFAENPRVQNLREESRLRIAKLVQRAVDEIRSGNCSVDAATRFVDWIEPLLRRESYLALLVERPNVQRRLLRLLGLARWPVRYLMLHPGVIDELADERTMIERFEPAALTAELEDRHAAWTRSGEADEGALLDTLRRAHPRRDLPHAGARRRGPHHRGGGGRRAVRARRHHPRAQPALGLGPPQAAPSRPAAAGRDRLRQAGRQGAGLRQRPRRGVPLRRRRRSRPLPSAGDLRGVRAQADHLADAAHRGRRAVRHRHRAAPPTATRGCWSRPSNRSSATSAAAAATPRGPGSTRPSRAHASARATPSWGSASRQRGAR